MAGNRRLGRIDPEIVAAGLAGEQPVERLVDRGTAAAPEQVAKLDAASEVPKTSKMLIGPQLGATRTTGRPDGVRSGGRSRTSTS